MYPTIIIIKIIDGIGSRRHSRLLAPRGPGLRLGRRSGVIRSGDATANRRRGLRLLFRPYFLRPNRGWQRCIVIKRRRRRRFHANCGPPDQWQRPGRRPHRRHVPDTPRARSEADGDGPTVLDGILELHGHGSRREIAHVPVQLPYAAYRGYERAGKWRETLPRRTRSFRAPSWSRAHRP